MNDSMISFSFYWRALKAKMFLIVFVTLVAGLAAYGITARVAPTYQVHFSYLVSLAQRETKGGDYHFDGYYALQATDLFSATLAKWATAPEIVVAAYEEAGLVVPVDVKQVIRSVTAEKTAPQLVQMTVSQSSEAQATSLAEALRKVVQQNVDRYHDQGIPELVFRVVPTASWVGVVRPSASIVAFAVAVFVFIVGINVVLFSVSVKE